MNPASLSIHLFLHVLSFFAGYELKVRADRRATDKKLAEASSHFALRSYPWAGSLSTAHTFLYYQRFGPKAFHGAQVGESFDYELGISDPVGTLSDEVATAYTGYEEKIWNDMIYEFREVSRSLYEHLSGGLRYKFRA